MFNHDCHGSVKKLKERAVDSTRRRIKRGWMNLKVTKIMADNHNTKTLVFEDLEQGGRQFDYTAGQYLTFRFDHLADKPVVRSYTMSSSPRHEKDAAITVKEVDDGFVSKYLCQEVKTGDVLRARGPIGKFCYDPNLDNSHIVMVAAGSGVTPFISIMYQEMPYLGQEGHPTAMSLLVSFRSRNDLIAWDVIKELKTHPQISVYTSLSRDHAEDEGFWYGRIDKDALAKACHHEYKGKTFMTCGPEDMMELVVKHLKEQGVEEQHIKLESFDS